MYTRRVGAAGFILFTGLAFGQTGSPRSLVEFNGAIEELIRRVAPSVVQILVSGYGPQADSDRRNTGVTIGHQRAIGSGFVIDAEGYVMTNAHVVSGAERIEVILPPVNLHEPIAAALTTKTKILPARIVGVASDLDIALLKVEGLGLPALPLAAYRDLRQGELVFAFGSPEGLRNTVTHGMVSAVARQNDPDSPRISIQTDAPINPGNSGGPLVNIKGEVVGMDTFILSQSGGNEGLGFAIPCATLRVAFRQLKQFGRLRRQEIGISIQTVTPQMASALGLPQPWGVIVSDTQPGGPAEKSGMQPGDVLVSVDGQPAENVPTVSYYFLLRDSGEKVHIEFLRGKDKMAADVPILEEKHDIDGVLALATPDKNLVSEIGVLGVEIDKRLAPLVPQLRHPYGIIIAARTSGAAHDIPLVPGDVVLAINNLPTMTLDGLRTALKKLAPGDPVVLQVERDGKLMYLAFTLD
ncbi:MAG TPA: trypsin-like peptidase domain-containing protein [Bryobacteraceae bacterium]